MFKTLNEMRNWQFSNQYLNHESPHFIRFASSSFFFVDKKPQINNNKGGEIGFSIIRFDQNLILRSSGILK